MLLPSRFECLAGRLILLASCVGILHDRRTELRRFVSRLSRFVTGSLRRGERGRGGLEFFLYRFFFCLSRSLRLASTRLGLDRTLARGRSRLFRTAGNLGCFFLSRFGGRYFFESLLRLGRKHFGRCPLFFCLRKPAIGLCNLFCRFCHLPIRLRRAFSAATCAGSGGGGDVEGRLQPPR